ncbi:MAG: hypothetical protein IKN39_00820 [Clostridia bacterium]|nr:hypothetical protein [Clostridia bacterium]
MINRIHSLPLLDELSAEAVKIENMFTAYPKDSKLFIQAETNAVIYLIGSDAVIYGKSDTEELKQFLSFLRPNSVFTSADNLRLLFDNFEEVNVLICKNPPKNTWSNMFSYDFSSREAYDLLSIDEFSLPDYEYFATDYCRRKNRGLIKVYGKKDACIAITLECENFRLLNGIVSKQKGLGGALLLAAISGDKPILAVCRDELIPFYNKYGFTPVYKAGYWRK